MRGKRRADEVASNSGSWGLNYNIIERETDLPDLLLK